MQNLRLTIAVLVGKTIIKVNRLLGKKGTSLPGMIALKLHPELIKQLSSQHSAVIVVTGTNGKTTTSNLLAEIFREKGVALTHNSAGANMLSGIATAFIATSNLKGKAKNDTAIIEIDEATMPKAIPMLDPGTVVITNFFRDQLDRYGELDKTIQLTVEAICNIQDAQVVLNADDPLVATIGKKIKSPAVYFGVEKNKYSSNNNTQVVEGRYCTFCKGKYEYEYYQYGQLGDYFCPHCGYKRPQPDYLASNPELAENTTFTLVVGDKSEAFKLTLKGFYNLYNALAAITTALVTGIDMETVKAGVNKYAPQAGRMEKFNIKGRDTTLTLVKNPTGFNEVLKTVVRSEGHKNLVIAINDLEADGTDVSWLWDVDFEILRDESVDNVICSGLRGEDMAVRLKYAGVSTDKIIQKKDLQTAINDGLEKTPITNKLFVLPTYTNLFPVEDILRTLDERPKA